MVNGGFNRLLSYFIKKFNPEIIENYSDNMFSKGDIYEKYGFKLKSENKPSYKLLINKKRTHRLSNTQVDYPKIWNAGYKKWELNYNI
jgi:hypothetical protein